MVLTRLTSLAFIVVVGALAFASTAYSQESVEWSYEGATGPANWASLSPAFRTCGEGSRQSPIDLRDAVHQPDARIRTAYTPSAVTQRHNGETVEVRSDLAQTLFVGDKPYTLVQLHFHSPAEHPVAGALQPLEIHFVHQAADGERAVLGALVSVGRANDDFGLLVNSFPRIPLPRLAHHAALHRGDPLDGPCQGRADLRAAARGAPRGRRGQRPTGSAA